MPMTAEDITRQNALKVKADAENDRMDEAADRLDLYVDDFEEIIDEEIKGLFTKKNYDRLRLFINGSQNILKRVINEISIIYIEEPTRATNPESERYAEIEKETRIDLKMKKVNRFTNLLNETIIKVGAREDRLSGWQISYDILTPDIVMVVQNDDDPTIADGYVYMRAWRDTKNNVNSEYHSWNIDGTYIIYNEKFQQKEIVYYDDRKDEDSEWAYPYKNSDGELILPFVVFHRQEPDWDFWDRDSGRDLINATIAVHIKMTLFDYYYKVSSFKQIYLIGDISKVPQDQVMDPQSILSVPADSNAQIGVLDVQANLNQLREAIQFQINSIINNYGISSDAFTLKIPELSGIALQLRQKSLNDRTKDQKALYRIYETELFDITIIVNNAWPKKFKNIKEDTEFSIDFREPEFPIDPKDELKFDMLRLKSGTISPGEFYIKNNPDAGTIEEAEKQWLENLVKTRDAIIAVPEVDAAINAILGLSGQGSSVVIGEEE